VDEPDQPIVEAFARAVLGAAMGLLFSLICLTVGALRSLLVLLLGRRLDLTGLWPDVAWYVLGLVAAGAVMGAAWPRRDVRWRQYLAGALAGMTVFAVLARLSDGPVSAWQPHTYMMVMGLGTVFGGVAARSLRIGLAA
jgi:hypothetical protein